LGPASEKGNDDAVTSLAIAVATIRMELDSARDPMEMFQSYSLELEGNVFKPPVAEVSNTNDIGGMPFWQMNEDDY